MENHNFIQFKKRRDLGLILSDAIEFLKVEWKSFFITVLRISIIPILVAVGAMIYYVMSFSTLFGDLLQRNSGNDFSSFNSSGIVIPLILFFISYLIAYAQMTVTSLSYIKSYIENRGIVNYQDISNTTKEKFLTYVGLFFLNALIVGFGALFCFLPGIYFGVILSVSICILIFNNRSATESISDSFNFMKGHWWETFGVLLVVQILIGIIGFFAGLPASFYQSTDMVSVLQNNDSTEFLNAFKDPIYLALLFFSYFVNFILYIVTTIVAVLIYFDIKEQKNPTAADDVINEIGVE